MNYGKSLTFHLLLNIGLQIHMLEQDTLLALKIYFFGRGQVQLLISSREIGNALYFNHAIAPSMMSVGYIQVMDLCLKAMVNIYVMMIVLYFAMKKQVDGGKNKGFFL